jgi:hypothetical protein
VVLGAGDREGWEGGGGGLTLEEQGVVVRPAWELMGPDAGLLCPGRRENGLAGPTLVICRGHTLANVVNRVHVIGAFVYRDHGSPPIDEMSANAVRIEGCRGYCHILPI